MSGYQDPDKALEELRLSRERADSHFEKANEISDEGRYMGQVRLRFDFEKHFGPLHLHGNGTQWPEWALAVARRLEWH